MNTPSFLMIFVPLSNIFLSNIGPVHCSEALFFIKLPLSLKIISRWIIIHFSVTIFQIILKASLKYTAAFEDNFSLTMLFTLKPLTLISSFLDSILSNTMP